VRITWAIEGHGAGSADVDDVDAAARALAAAVRDAYAKHGAGVQAHVLASVVAPLRASLVTDGRWEVERGREWSTSRGGILATLYP
jgi:hypothetical protein